PRLPTHRVLLQRTRPRDLVFAAYQGPLALPSDTPPLKIIATHHDSGNQPVVGYPSNEQEKLHGDGQETGKSTHRLWDVILSSLPRAPAEQVRRTRRPPVCNVQTPSVPRSFAARLSRRPSLVG